MNRSVNACELHCSYRTCVHTAILLLHLALDMFPEFLVVEGPLAGSSFQLRPGIQIGKAPDCAICLPLDGVAWRHSKLTAEENGLRLIDLASGSGTYVNGLRTRDHVLEDGDHVAIGPCVMVYRPGGDRTAPDSTRVTLLRACSLWYLFRALACAQSPEQQSLLERQVLRLIEDMIPLEMGAILRGRSSEAIHSAALDREAGLQDTGPGPNLSKVAAKTALEGIALDQTSRLMGVALYAAAQLEGVLVVRYPLAVASLDGYQDTLAALATLAGLALETGRELRDLRTRADILEERLGASSNIVGRSAAIERVLAMVERVAPQEATVLLLGESGTGKELIAQTVHRKSPRRCGPFVPINCATLTANLLESELFGHEKGAFTGAASQKKGKLEIAEGGTVFLDEIGELAPELQARLLRVLQEREFERVGGTRSIKMNVRLIAATNRDLPSAVRAGAFREDLYQRLNVIVLRSPALRERREDIPLLARHFLAQASARCRRRVSGISGEAERLLVGYNWPGNVRELENAIERAVVLGDAEVLMPEDLPETVLLEQPDNAEIAGTLFASVGDTKRDCILRAWAEARGDYKAAARLLGLHPNSLLRLIRTLSLRDALPRYPESPA